MNYYNEWDKSAAEWLRELIRQGMIPAGDVDERSITDVKQDDLTKYTQCHFFAGIGGWPLALELASWPTDRPVWTGSCPCQPFSSAGKQRGHADERHLWAAFFNLIRQCKPDTVFGEQVESAINHGWLDSVSADMEGEGYAIGAAVLGAHSVGAPHRRQRLYWVAYANPERRTREHALLRAEKNRWEQREIPKIAGRSADSAVAIAQGQGRGQRGTESSGWGVECGCPNGVAQGNADLAGPQGHGLQSGDNAGSWTAWTTGVDFILCTDGRKRLVKSGIFPLAHGVSGRVGLLRGSGNAIVPQVAAAFIQTSEEARNLTHP